MFFCGKESKFNVGDNVHIIKEDKMGVITDIGILGGKLSNWVFLYEVISDGKKNSYIEEGLEYYGTN